MREYEVPDEDEIDPILEERDVIEPGRPSLENAVFVLLGVASAIAVLVHVATLFG